MGGRTWEAKLDRDRQTGGGCAGSAGSEANFEWLFVAVYAWE